MLRASLKYRIGCIKKPLAYYRIHESNTSLKKIGLQIQELENWIISKKTSRNFNSFSFNGPTFVLQTLKIKKNFLDGNKISAFKEIIKFPFNLKKYKFLLLLFVPNRKLNLFIR